MWEVLKTTLADGTPVLPAEFASQRGQIAEMLGTYHTAWS
jgi:hypothetical protein